MSATDQSIREIRIATRKSALALWQAEFVKAELEAAHPHLKNLRTHGEPWRPIVGLAFIKNWRQRFICQRG